MASSQKERTVVRIIYLPKISEKSLTVYQKGWNIATHRNGARAALRATDGGILNADSKATYNGHHLSSNSFFTSVNEPACRR